MLLHSNSPVTRQHNKHQTHDLGVGVGMFAYTGWATREPHTAQKFALSVWKPTAAKVSHWVHWTLTWAWPLLDPGLDPARKFWECETWRDGTHLSPIWHSPWSFRAGGFWDRLKFYFLLTVRCAWRTQARDSITVSVMFLTLRCPWWTQAWESITASVMFLIQYLF